jgi:hypothetical protein
MTLGGFSGATEISSDSIRRKIALLRAEGVRLKEESDKGQVTVFGKPYEVRAPSDV